MSFMLHLDGPEMRRVTVQQRLLWDWNMEMEGRACEETGATEAVDAFSNICLCGGVWMS